MLRSAQLQGATTQQAVLKFIGKKQPHEILSKFHIVYHETWKSNNDLYDNQ